MKKFNNFFKINKSKIGKNFPTYFIADIAANHDGKLSKALKLIELAAKNGAQAAKFQHFMAETIVSDYEFKNFRSQLSHQSKWKKSVYEVYKNASIPLSWTNALVSKCKECNIDFFSAVYDLNYVDKLNKYMSAYKIGSGDLTWDEMLTKISKKKKPVIIATGASDAKEVEHAINILNKKNRNICIMQCNTNYTADEKNFENINLNVLKFYKKKFPNIILGLSDHTKGYATVLGAIALGARVVEKHFTDNNDLKGPDHLFSMNPKSWNEMILASRQLEKSFGDGIKKIEKNEKQTVIIHRRAVCTSNFLAKNTKIKKSDLICLRPSPKKSIQPKNINKIIGKITKKDFHKGQCIYWKDLK